jgi:hypothetical protein
MKLKMFTASKVDHPNTTYRIIECNIHITPPSFRCTVCALSRLAAVHLLSFSLRPFTPPCLSKPVIPPTYQPRVLGVAMQQQAERGDAAQLRASPGSEGWMGGRGGG